MPALEPPPVRARKHGRSFRILRPGWLHVIAADKNHDLHHV
jgi:hypothetical protein